MALAMLEEKRIFAGFSVDEVTNAPLRIRKTAVFYTDPQTIFDYLIEHDKWAEWFDTIESVSARGNMRTCRFDNGDTSQERIYAVTEPTQFGYAIVGDNPFDVEDHFAMIHLRKNADNSTTLNYYQYFNHPAVDHFAWNMHQLLQNGLNNLITRFGGDLLV